MLARHYGEYFIKHTCIKSLCCTSEDSLMSVVSHKIEIYELLVYKHEYSTSFPYFFIGINRGGRRNRASHIVYLKYFVQFIILIT